MYPTRSSHAQVMFVSSEYSVVYINTLLLCDCSEVRELPSPGLFIFLLKKSMKSVCHRCWPCCPRYCTCVNRSSLQHIQPNVRSCMGRAIRKQCDAYQCFFGGVQAEFTSLAIIQLLQASQEKQQQWKKSPSSGSCSWEWGRAEESQPRSKSEVGGCGQRALLQCASEVQYLTRHRSI